MAGGAALVSEKYAGWLSCPGVGSDSGGEEIRLGCTCFLGCRSVVMRGVHLGGRCVVGAQAVVTRSFPAGSMLTGSPARMIKQYDARAGAWQTARPSREQMP